MATVVLLRHGRSTANASAVLAGRTPGVGLDDTGRAQAQAVVGRLAEVRFDRLICSPLQRCQETVAPLAAATGLPVQTDDRFAEVDYGDWSGRPLAELAKEPLWRVIQGHPSAAVFPGGEGLAGVSARAVAGIRAQLADSGPDDVLLICSHGDVIAAILADALGLHLDTYQRLVLSPGSLSIIRYTELRPFVEHVNDTGPLGTLRPPPAPPAPADPDPRTGPTPDPTTSTSDSVPGGPAR